MTTRRVSKKESDYTRERHKRLSQKKQFKTKYLTEIVQEKQDDMSTKPIPKRNLKRFLQIKLLVQFIVAVAVFSIFYVYTIQEYPTNGFIQLISFYLLYGFLILVVSGVFFRFLSGKGYNFSIIFYQFFYTIAIVIGVFGITYLPMLLILFVTGQIGDWIRYAFITALVVFPISYMISLVYNFIKERGMTVKEYMKYVVDKERRVKERAEEKEKQEKLYNFYEDLEKTKEIYDEKTSRKLSKKDFKKGEVEK